MAMAQLFNFLIKFGLSRETPVTTSLGTQIGAGVPRREFTDVVNNAGLIMVIMRPRGGGLDDNARLACGFTCV